MFVDLVLLRENFEAEPVSFTVLAQFVRVGGPEDNIDNFGKLRQNLRQGIDYIFDALVRREQSEGKQHHLPFHSKLVLEIGRIHESHVGNAVRDEIYLGRRCLVNLL